jgi:transposase
LIRLCESFSKCKNMIFFGSDAGGERAAGLYTLVESGMLNNFDPEAYLRYVFERIARQPINRIQELLPWHVAEALAPGQVAKAA